MLASQQKSEFHLWLISQCKRPMQYAGEDPIAKRRKLVILKKELSTRTSYTSFSCLGSTEKMVPHDAHFSIAYQGQ